MTVVCQQSLLSDKLYCILKHFQFKVYLLFLYTYNMPYFLYPFYFIKLFKCSEKTKAQEALVHFLCHLICVIMKVLKL